MEAGRLRRPRGEDHGWSLVQKEETKGLHSNGIYTKARDSLSVDRNVEMVLHPYGSF